MNKAWLEFAKRDKQRRDKQQISEQSRAENEADELFESWVNGNRSFVLDEIAKMSPIKAAFMGADLAQTSMGNEIKNALERKI